METKPTRKERRATNIANRKLAEEEARAQLQAEDKAEREEVHRRFHASLKLLPERVEAAKAQGLLSAVVYEIEPEDLLSYVQPPYNTQSLKHRSAPGWLASYLPALGFQARVECRPKPVLVAEWGFPTPRMFFRERAGATYLVRVSKGYLLRSQRLTLEGCGTFLVEFVYGTARTGEDEVQIQLAPWEGDERWPEAGEEFPFTQPFDDVPLCCPDVTWVRWTFRGFQTGKYQGPPEQGWYSSMAVTSGAGSAWNITECPHCGAPLPEGPPTSFRVSARRQLLGLLGLRPEVIRS